MLFYLFHYVLTKRGKNIICENLGTVYKRTLKFWTISKFYSGKAPLKSIDIFTCTSKFFSNVTVYIIAFWNNCMEAARNCYIWGSDHLETCE